jgi:tetratricopeptide (TPR) repeat protein
MNLPHPKSFVAAATWFVGVTIVALSVHANPPDAARPAPLFDGLGSHSHPVSTQNALAQRYFDQGLMFLYGFNHYEAIRSFEAAAALDPECAMAWWGVAFAHGPNINAPMESTAVPPAWIALERARSSAPRATPRERAYIEALTTRYAEDPAKGAGDRAELDHAYAEAMRKVATQFPDDLDARTLFADAVMNTMAWDYWLPDRITPKPATLEISRVIEDVLARDPDHPGANHAYIHLIEAGPEPWRALPSADRLQTLAPSAGHLVHMPAHIYIRTGRYDAAVETNRRAVIADRGYIAQCQAQGFYPGMYYPHNLHFIWYALSFTGQAEDCIAAAQQVVAFATSPLCGTEVAEKPRFMHLPLLAQVRFGRWSDILATNAPDGETTPLDHAMWHYARTLAFAAQGDGAAATRESAALDEIIQSGKIAALDNPYLPASGIAEIAQHVAAAKAAGARGDVTQQLARLRQAVAAEQALPYMEPAFWYYPTRQSLAAALLAHGQAKEAESVFRDDLREFPRNGWSLHGLAAALQAQDRADEAQLVSREAATAWARADSKPDLQWY